MYFQEHFIEAFEAGINKWKKMKNINDICNLCKVCSMADHLSIEVRGKYRHIPPCKLCPLTCYFKDNLCHKIGNLMDAILISTDETITRFFQAIR